MRLVILAAAASAAITALAAVAPASAAPQCASNANIAYVHRRLDGAIAQLQHDDRDYGGHRAAAVSDLSAARFDLIKAERYAVRVYRDNPACFRSWAPTGAGWEWGVRGQGRSNRDVWGVRRWIADLIGQLESDNRDYGGSKAAAIAQLRAARGQLLAAERDAFGHGY